MTTLDFDRLSEYPVKLVKTLAEVGKSADCSMYITGGAVRDWLLGTSSRDLDVTVTGEALQIGRDFADRLAAAFVLLDEREKVARVVWRNYVVDFSSLREGSSTIDEDLGKRDFTINALAVLFDKSRACLSKPLEIIDPTGGIKDIEQKIVRATSNNIFSKDPLRLVRAYRFRAALNFSIAPQTALLLTEQVKLLHGVANERIAYELDGILSSGLGAVAFAEMAAGGLLWEIFPELKKAVGVRQPAGHHLDVFSHCLATLAAMELLFEDPEKYFPHHVEQMREYFRQGRRKVRLKMAAVFHDLGKPGAARKIKGRVTFYNHDMIGADKFAIIAERLRLSNDDKKNVARFIKLHMWPFHLNNVWRQKGVSARACLRLIKAVDDDLPGLFLLAMADSLAAQGPGKPIDVEVSLAGLYEEVDRVYHESIKPVLSQPRLINGNELIEVFGLTPGPAFRHIFTELEKAQVSGEVKTKNQALAWIETFLDKQ